MEGVLHAASPGSCRRAPGAVACFSLEVERLPRVETAAC